MIVLITLLCVLLSLILFAGAFYLAKHVVSLQHRVHVLEDSYKEATEHIAQQEEHIITLKQELDFIRRTEEVQHQRERPRTWNPGDPLNSNSRL